MITAASTPKLTAFRNCFEGGMDFETALGCAGLSPLPDNVKAIFRRQWNRWEAISEGNPGCDCGAATTGKWAGIHSINCASECDAA